MGAFGAIVLRGQRGVPAARFSTPLELVSRREASVVSGELLVQVLLVAAPSTMLLATGRLLAAAVCMWSLLGCLCARLVFMRRPDEMACLLIATAPLINLLRGVVLYSAVPIVYLGSLAYLYWSVPAQMRRVTNRFPLTLPALAALYYALSVLGTGDPRQNMRVFELACAAPMVVLIGRSRKALFTALIGLLVSAWAVGVGSYSHLDTSPDNRLGAIVAEGFAFGDPFALGMPLALGALTLCLDGGRWLGLQNRPGLRLAALLPTFFFLAQSGSRAGQLVTVAGLLVAAAFRRRDRFKILAFLFLMGLLGMALLGTPLGSPFQKAFQRTFGEGRTLTQASTGRADMWRTFWYTLTDDGVALILGHGAGSGREQHEIISARVSDTQFAGKSLEFHALIMHVGVEFGLCGLVPLLLWLTLGARTCFRGSKTTGLALPLACFLGFVLGSLTTTGFDTVSGTLLGIGLLLGGPTQPSWSRRLTRLRPSIVRATTVCSLGAAGPEPDWLLVELTRPRLEEHLEELMRIDRGLLGEEWQRSHFLMDLPGKWDLSQLALDSKGHAMGFVITSRKPAGPHLHRIAVAESCRRKGIGVHLLAAAAAAARRQGPGQMTCKVHTENLSSQHFLRQLGWQRVGKEGTNYLMAVDLDELIHRARGTQPGPA
jgi:ribosomal protein S18 acetylase RimI-like enzyme